MVRRARPGRKPRLPYPLVQCAEHAGDPLPGYVVCVHAMNDPTVEVATVERATAQSAGTVLCHECVGHKDLPVDRLVTACAHYVAEHFGVPL